MATLPSCFNNDSVQPRAYQTAIFERAIRENLLVVIPTGLGKTLIAALLAGYYLDQYHHDMKVIFLAPTRPLINQQLEACRNNLLLEESQYAILTGQIPPPKRVIAFQQTCFLFMTPETLINDLENGEYGLEKTMLIIFDEAHRASGDYAYTRIARCIRP